MSSKYWKIVLALIAGLSFFKAKADEQAIRISRATCEGRLNPTGVGLQEIFFGWEMESDENNQVQTVYQLVISSTENKLKAGNYDVWNSSMVNSNESVAVGYRGKKLSPGTTYYWRVRVCNKQKKVSAWSPVQYFITGLFDKKDWTGARWIEYEHFPDSMRLAPGAENINGTGNKALQRMTVPYFRKTFPANKKIQQALAFVTGVGQYEMEVNGNKVGNSFLSPGWTYYDKTILYNTYDITSMLQQGSNAVGVTVGNGFYNVNKERYVKLLVAFGSPKMICKIIVRYTDGSIDNIVSDASWKTTASPITYSSIYGGEDYDARKEQSGWSSANFNDSQWKTALITATSSGIKLLPETDYPVAVMDTIHVKKIQQVGNGYLYDFGQNASGIVSLQVKGNKGDTIKLIPAELIDSANMPNQNASGKPYYFTYILKGDGIESWQPRFSYYGFRYVWVKGAMPADEAKSNQTQLVQLNFLHTRNSSFSTGSFECSNQLFNKIYTLINWAIKSNLQSVVTDCPHREKLGWMEQTHLMGNSIQYNFNVQLLYRRLVHDMIDAQLSNGLVPDIAPELVVFGGGFRDSPEWGSAAVILPWLLYQWYGDTATMHNAYNMMKKYLAYLESKSDHHILSHGLGDWYDYGPKFPGEAQLTPKAVTATAIYYYDVLLLSKMATILNHKNDAVAFTQQAANIKQAFNKKFFNDVTKVYSTGSQTAMAMPLCVGLVDDANKKAVLKNLVDSIYKNNKALTAGDVGFHFLIQALDEGGASQLIYDMNNREDVAGYGYQLKKGATVLTESWQALAEVSNNHLMLGHIMEWFYSGLAGISQEENSVAYCHVKIRPQPVGDITSAKGSFHSPYGWIRTEWKKSSDEFFLQVEIPVNTKATVYLPAKVSSVIYKNGRLSGKEKIKIKEGFAMFTIGSGKYHFRVN